jgi:hypothetical protein
MVAIEKMATQATELHHGTLWQAAADTEACATQPICIVSQCKRVIASTTLVSLGHYMSNSSLPVQYMNTCCAQPGHHEIATSKMYGGSEMNHEDA